MTDQTTSTASGSRPVFRRYERPTGRSIEPVCRDFRSRTERSNKLKRIKLAAAVVGVLALIPASLAFAGKPAGDSIWIIGPSGAAAQSTLSYGATFRAGYSSKASSPYGHAQCWANSTSLLASPTSGPILDEYRQVQPDGTLGTFSL